jgi:hypothetical protein
MVYIVTCRGVRVAKNWKVLDRMIGFIGPTVIIMTASVVYWSEFLAADPEVPFSIPGPTRFSEK